MEHTPVRWTSRPAPPPPGVPAVAEEGIEGQPTDGQAEGGEADHPPSPPAAAETSVWPPASFLHTTGGEEGLDGRQDKACAMDGDGVPPPELGPLLCLN